MNKSVFISIISMMILGAAVSVSAQDTDYKATPVTISKDKVRNNGKLYYSHVVLAKQTLFSISKAYNVSIQDIYDSNPALNLEEEGLKTYQILLIPIVEDAQAAAQPGSAGGIGADEAVQTPVVKENPQPVEIVPDNYTVHTVKWFEDLESIAKKYGVSKEAIMRANGLSNPVVTRKQKLKIPLGEYAGADDEEDSVTEDDKNIFETIGEAISDKAEEILSPGSKDIRTALILPFNAQKQPNENNLDFYSGVLLAVRDLAKEGINTELDVFDAAGGVIPVDEDAFDSYDVVLGPISTADITSTLKLCGSRTTVVSPLEPKAAGLAAMHDNLIQAPSSTESQCEDLINWLREEYRTGDKLILFTEKSATRTSAANELVSLLANSGLQYSTVSYGLLEGKNIAGEIERNASPDHTIRIVVASESEAFVNDVVRNANLVAHRKFNVAIYCTSKVRSFETIEVENLHNTNLHTSISYYVDYDSPKVQKFLMAYRALFNTEPGPFAFQGYDTASYFFRMSSEFGRNWAGKLDANPGKGLQSDFNFNHGTDGHVNTAVRRILYEPEFKVRLVSGK